ncbi:hypothetical protein Vi05172_g11501 [Venturia inaequalis]|nr:hypothetical protein Vi05172_g11501 [Venturia inaequalis]
MFQQRWKIHAELFATKSAPFVGSRDKNVFPLTAYGPQGAIDVYLEILSAPNLRPRTPKVVNARLVNLQSQQSNPDPMPNGQGLMHLHHSKGKAPPSYK